MGITRAQDYQNYTSDGSNFIPEIWSGKLVEKLYDATVFAEISNTDYEGEIKDKGDTVHIRTVPTVTINQYTVGGDINYETLTSDGVDLTIDYADYFAFRCDDIDRKQSDIKELDSWSDETSQQMKIHIDRAMLGAIYADAAAANAGTEAGRISGDINLGEEAHPLEITASNVLDFILDMGLVLDEQNVPEIGRWLILPAWVCSLLKRSDIKNAALTGDAVSPVRNGKIGMVDRFTIYSSNAVKVTSTVNFNPIAGHKSGLTFAAQLTKMETLRIQNSFGDFVRGLQVYGFEVINDACIAAAVIKKG